MEVKVGGENPLIHLCFSEKIKISLSQLNDVKISPTSCIKIYGIEKLLENIIDVYN